MRDFQAIDTFKRVCMIPVGAGNASTLSARMTSHMSRRFPEQEHEAFNFDYKLFSDTSSHVPGVDSKVRAFTHVLSLSHNSKSTFVRTTKLGQPEDGSTITIPFTSAEIFTNLLTTKMQPLWYLRQMLNVENGVMVSLKDKQWRLCFGDVKLSPKQQGAGNMRGLFLELRLEDGQMNSSDTTISPDEITEYRELFRSVLNESFKGVATFDEANLEIDYTQSTDEQSSDNAMHSRVDWNLAKIYMSVLKGQR